MRNALLFLPYSDIDICSALLPEQMAEICTEFGIKCIVANRKLGTLHIDIDGEVLEYTSFRKESYPKGGAHEPISVKIGVSMEEDAFRRDFSVNALYYDILTGEVLDPTQKGLRDIKLKRLSTTTDDPDVIMRDDALRMLRLCRFAAELGFTIEPRTAEVTRNNKKLLQDISAERIYGELARLLMADTKYPQLSLKVPAHKRGLNALVGCGLFTEIFPEYIGADTIGKCAYHRHNVLFHVINTCALMPPSLEYRYAGLLHDIGKCRCYFASGKMLGHDVLGAKLAKNRLTELKAPKRLVLKVCDIVRWHMYDLSGMAKESTLRKQIVRMGKESFRDLIIMRRADVYGSGMMAIGSPVATADKFENLIDKMEKEGAPFTLGELAIDGKVLMQENIASGKELGILLNKLLLAAACKPRLNKREKLINEARQLSRNTYKR